MQTKFDKDLVIWPHRREKQIPSESIILYPDKPRLKAPLFIPVILAGN